MRKLMLFAVALVAVGCGDDNPNNWTCEGKHDYGAEEVVVLAKSYTPPMSDSGIAPGYNFGKGGGVTFSHYSVSVPEKYSVVVRHADGTVEPFEDKAAFGELEIGQPAKILTDRESRMCVCNEPAKHRKFEGPWLRGRRLAN